MTEEDELIREVEAAIKANRPYAGFFDWPEREVAERGIASVFAESAENEPGFPLSDLRSRPRGEDPPDCEAVDVNGRRIAIEVTELVDEQAAAAARRSSRAQWAEWDSAKIQAAIQKLLTAKDSKVLKGGPYDEYIVLLHTDEPGLSIVEIDSALTGYQLVPPKQIQRAYLLLSYDPGRRRYPYVRLL